MTTAAPVDRLVGFVGCETSISDPAEIDEKTIGLSQGLVAILGATEERVYRTVVADQLARSFRLLHRTLEHHHGNVGNCGILFAMKNQGRRRVRADVMCQQNHLYLYAKSLDTELPGLAPPKGIDASVQAGLKRIIA